MQTTLGFIFAAVHVTVYCSSVCYLRLEYKLAQGTEEEVVAICGWSH